MEKKNDRYLDTLKRKVLALSHSTAWEKAKHEWVIVGHTTDEECGGVCECTKTHLYHLYTIKNKITRHSLWYIGSSCINHFNNQKMTEAKTFLEKLKQMGKRKVQFGIHANKTFEQTPLSYIDYLRTLRRLKYDKYRQLIEYDDMRRKSTQTLGDSEAKWTNSPSFYD